MTSLHKLFPKWVVCSQLLEPRIETISELIWYAIVYVNCSWRTGGQVCCVLWSWEISEMLDMLVQCCDAVQLYFLESTVVMKTNCSVIIEEHYGISQRHVKPVEPRGYQCYSLIRMKHTFCYMRPRTLLYADRKARVWWHTSIWLIVIWISYCLCSICCSTSSQLQYLYCCFDCFGKRKIRL